MLHFDSATGELIQIAGLLVVLLVTRKRRLPVTHGVGLWCVVMLSVDVFIFHCHRPTLLREAFNAGTVLLSLGVLYEHYRELVKVALSFFWSLFM